MVSTKRKVGRFAFLALMDTNKKKRGKAMLKRTCALMLSLVMLCTILLPTQLTVFAAGETETPSAAADEGVMVDDIVTDNTQKHYFTYSAAKDPSGHKGWAEDTKDKIIGGTEAKTQH